jgi:hypothetical protein
MEDKRFVNSPLYLPLLQFGPRQRVMIQIVLTTVMFSALYFGAYLSTPRILDATKWSGMTMPKNTELPGWVMLLMPILAIIPGVYVFLFLKYNFNY